MAKAQKKTTKTTETATKSTVVKRRSLKETKAAKDVKKQYSTPVGRFSYPFFLEPKTGGKYPSNKYEVDLLCLPKDFNFGNGEALQLAVIEAAQNLFNDDTITSWEEFKSPFKEVTGPDGVTYIRIRAKSMFKPTIYNAQTEEMDDDEVKEIKGGDNGLLVVSIYAWDKDEGGVSLNLDAAQFWKPGEAFGQGKSAALELLEEMEVPLEELDTSADDEGDEEDDHNFE